MQNEFFICTVKAGQRSSAFCLGFFIIVIYIGDIIYYDYEIGLDKNILISCNY